MLCRAVLEVARKAQLRARTRHNRRRLAASLVRPGQRASPQESHGRYLRAFAEGEGEVGEDEAAQAVEKISAQVLAAAASVDDSGTRAAAGH